MTLRPYQQRAVDAARDAVRAGHRRVLLVSPTGTGKTKTMAALAKSCLDRGGSVHWYAHRAELLEQARAELDPRVEVISTQAALRRARPDPTVQIFDEGHHYVASEWSRLLSPRSVIVAATATPERSDGRGLGEAFDVLIPVISIREATEQGFLVPCTVHAPERELGRREIAQVPWAAYRQFTPGEQAIVFAPTIEDASFIAADFSRAGIAADYVHHNSEERARTIARFRSGELRVLVNVFLLTEGFDHPPTSVCILARSCGSAGTYLQMVGRVLRPAPGKTKATLIDLRGVRHVHGDPADERVYSLDGVGIRKADAHDDGERFCEVCGCLMLQRTDGWYCEDCEIVATPKQFAPQTIANVPLRVYARDVCAADTPDVRLGRLRRWVAEGRARGHKPGAAMYRFKATYGRWPSRDEMQRAG